MGIISVMGLNVAFNFVFEKLSVFLLELRDYFSLGCLPGVILWRKRTQTFI